MNILKSKSFWVLLGMLLVSALSYPIWEYILKPSSSLLKKIILDIITLGMTKFKNEIYIEISRGFHEGPSLYLLCMAIALGIGILSEILFSHYILRRYFRKMAGSEQIKSRAISISSFYFVFVIILGIIFVVKIQYINSAISHFKQLCAIVSPYIDDAERKNYISKFAQIKNKDDYSKLVSELQSIGTGKNQSIPKFEIW